MIQSELSTLSTAAALIYNEWNEIESGSLGINTYWISGHAYLVLIRCDYCTKVFTATETLNLGFPNSLAATHDPQQAPHPKQMSPIGQDAV